LFHWPWSYLVLCWGAAAVAIVIWCLRQFHRPVESLLANHTSVSTLPLGVAGNRLTSLLARIPGNQILQIHVQEKRVELPRLHPALDGLSIAHLSDLHFTGQLSKAFYRQVVELANDSQADFVAITGDIVDKTACIEWIPDTIGRLQAPYGVFFVLGNHDLRVRNLSILRRTLIDSGLVDLAGRWTMVPMRNQPVLLAGNELPWIGPAPDLNESSAESSGRRPLRIALAHTPDQIGWARAGDMDLMLAGHTHGGQVCPPLVGPVVSCSRRDIRKVSGAYFEAPTLLHISRGIAGTRQLRINCPPELTKLILKCPINS
jgi:predicted MPP superfamily phosphohydrolase